MQLRRLPPHRPHLHEALLLRPDLGHGHRPAGHPVSERLLRPQPRPLHPDYGRKAAGRHRPHPPQHDQPAGGRCGEHRAGPHLHLRLLRRGPVRHHRRCCGHRHRSVLRRGHDAVLQPQQKPRHPDQLPGLPPQRQGHRPHLHRRPAQHCHAVRGQRHDLLHEPDPDGLLGHGGGGLRRLFQAAELRLHAHLRHEQRHGAHHQLQLRRTQAGAGQKDHPPRSLLRRVHHAGGLLHLPVPAG